jgi:hypothetical protein
MQIINDPSRASSLASSLGSGLNNLIEFKLADLTKQYEQKQERSNFAKTWEPILGKQSAYFLSSLAPEERKNAMQNIGSLIQLNEPPSSAEQVSGMQSLSNNQSPYQQQQFGPEEVQRVGKENYINKLLGQLGPQQPGMMQQQPQQSMQQQQPQQQMAPGITSEKAKLIENLFSTPQQKREKEKLEFQKRQENIKEKQFNIKETKKYVDALKDKEKAAKESDLRLKRMKHLIDKGNLPNANLWSFLSKIEDIGPLATGGVGALIGSVVPGIGTAAGAGVGGLVGALSGPLAGAAKSLIKSGSPDIEEFEKLTSDFVKNAKQYFGSRLTDADLKIFMQTLPTLMQTDAGKKKVIENLTSLNELAEIEAKAARSIIRDNGGIPPLDIEQQVKDKIEHKIDKVANRFISV